MVLAAFKECAAVVSGSQTARFNFPRVSCYDLLFSVKRVVNVDYLVIIFFIAFLQKCC